MPKDQKRVNDPDVTWELTSTEETLTQRVALTRICGLGYDQNKTVFGWEYAPPQKGERYTLYLGKGKYLRSSLVEDITHIPDAVMIKTANSLYELKYLK